MEMQEDSSSPRPRTFLTFSRQTREEDQTDMEAEMDMEVEMVMGEEEAMEETEAAMEEIEAAMVEIEVVATIGMGTEVPITGAADRLQETLSLLEGYLTPLQRETWKTSARPTMYVLRMLEF